MKLLVKNSKIIRLQLVKEKGRGETCIAESARNIPFVIKRIYTMKGMPRDVVRGNHAHKMLTQVIVCPRGSFTLELDDGMRCQIIVMNKPEIGVVLGPKLWATMSNFSDDCMIFVMADDYYDKNEYITDYEEFKRLTP